MRRLPASKVLKEFRASHWEVLEPYPFRVALPPKLRSLLSHGFGVPGFIEK